MNQNDKNKKFTPLNINNVFKGKSIDNQNKSSYRIAGMQNIGKVSSMRRVPAPKWVPSIKAETGASENKNINQSSTSWVNASSHEINDQNMMRNQLLNRDKNQWTSKPPSNKPFFLMGQEFPSLPSDSNQDSPIDSSKDNCKTKESESMKSKLDEIRNRDNSISASTLNRIDALSISKTAKGDIAATGWAAEDEEPNFDEKIVFSDDESMNEGQNWHSDAEEVVNKTENIMTQHEAHEPQRPMHEPTWFEQNQAPHYPQFQQFPVQVNLPNQFLTNVQFSQNIVNRPSSSSMTNISEDQSVLFNSVAEQRNARNMEYFLAIERARQKKMGNHGNRNFGVYNEEMAHPDSMSARSRHTSITSDTPESMNTPIEMGPPGGPPMMHSHLQKPHISPMMHTATIPMMSPPLAGPQTMIRFTQPGYMMPIQTMPMEADPKLLEKWYEFLKLQSSGGEPNYNAQMFMEQQQPQIVSRAVETKNVTVESEPEQPMSNSSFSNQQPQPVEKEREVNVDKKSEVKDVSQKEYIRKTKSLYAEDEASKSNNSKRNSKTKFSNYKDYRTKYNYKSDYGAKSDKDTLDYGEHYRGDDDLAYEDYHLYKQHYPSERHRDYNNAHDHWRNPSYHYYEEPYNRDLDDYNYRSNSLKYKSAKNKDYKSGPPIDSYQSDRGNTSTNRKAGSDIQEFQPTEKKSYEASDAKGNKDVRRNPKSTTSSYTNKRFDNRNYKDRSTENQQEFSMGFAVNPKDTNRNYYSTSYNRRGYSTDYSYYGYPANSNSKYNDYDNYYSDKSYNYQYDQDSTYSSNKSANRPPKNISEQWRTRDDKSSKSKVENGNLKTDSRPNRKSDKRQSSMPKENSNDNDLEEWETASEGGSARSNSAPRDGTKATGKHQSDQQAVNEDSSKKSQNASNDGQRDKRNGSNNSCNGIWPTYPDDDESDGPSGSVAGAKSNLPQSKSADSTDNAGSNSSNKTRSNDSTASKDGSTDTSNPKDGTTKPAERFSRTYSNFIEKGKSSTVINVDKLPEVTEDEELLYENVEQFQEVLSKSTKKNRKLEEQRRLKEEIEQKRREELKMRNKNESINLKKPFNKKEISPKQDKVDYNASRKPDNKIVTAHRDKEGSNSINSNNNNIVKKYENNKVSMHIGSWDNSLADDINSDKKAPPKPIGTPAPTSTWNAKVKSIPAANTMATVSPTSARLQADNLKDSNKSQNESKSNPQATKTVYASSSENTDAKYNSAVAYTYNNSIYERTNEEKIKSPLETKSSNIPIPDTITFDYDVKNVVKLDQSQRNTAISDRGAQKNDQQSLNDKICSVKTIWDNQAIGSTANENESSRGVAVMKPDPDVIKTTTCSVQDVIISVPSSSITNVCKVKPQLQQDFSKKDNSETQISPSAFTIRNSPAAFLSTQTQGNYMPYTPRFPPEFLSDLRNPDAIASLLSNTQAGMHLNYSLPNAHILESSLLRQNPQDHILTNKMNFISQSSFYPQPPVTPKMFSNAPGQLPLNMDIGSSHGALPLQQLLLTRQNSLTSMVPPNGGLPISFIQNGQQHGQTPLFPATPLLAPTNFSPQMNPFSQAHLPAHYSPGNFPSLHHHSPQFQQNQQMLLNQHHQQQQQQMLHNQLSHDRVINSGQSGIFNSILGSSDISTNTGLPDFSGQQKHLNHNNNIMHGMNASAFMLPHNLNILMKPHLFGTSSQYNGFQSPIQSHHFNMRNNYENHSNTKLAHEIDHYKSSEMNAVDRNSFCIDQYMDQNNYIDQNDYEVTDNNNESWINVRPTNANNSGPIDPNLTAYNDSLYRHFIYNNRDHQVPLCSSGVQSATYQASQRSKQQFQIEQSGNSARQAIRGYDNAPFVPNNQNFVNKNEMNDSAKGFVKCSCDSTVTMEGSDGVGKEAVHSEKSLSVSKKIGKQRSSLSDNFEDKNQSWAAMDDDNPETMKLKPSSTNAEDGGMEGGQLSPKKQYASPRSMAFDSQCQYGYDETLLTSQTAESLGKYDSIQLKKMIMKLREGPVMTFDSGGMAPKATVLPRLMHFPAGRGKAASRTYPHQGDAPLGSECAGMGFYSKGRALTPPATQARGYRQRGGHGRYSQASSASSGNQPRTVKARPDGTDKDDGCGAQTINGPQADCDGLPADVVVVVGSPVL